MKRDIWLYFTLFCISLAGLNLNGQAHSDSTINIRIPFSLKKASSSFQHEIYRENFINDSLTIKIPIGSLSSYKLQYPGLTLLPPEPKIDGSDMASDFDEALNFTKYPSYEQYVELMHYYAEEYPSICKIDTIGISIEGRLILALKISDNVTIEEDEPAFFYTATIHGDELAGYMLSMRLINFILSNYGSDIEIDRIVNDVEIWVNPLSNPDGTYRSGNSTVAGSIRGNSLGFDLNRNYPEYSDGDPDDTTGIQKENQDMMLFMRERKFDISANMHGGAEVVNYPWDRSHIRHVDTDWFVLISQEYADEARAVNSSYMDSFVDDSTGITGITNGADWYVIKGGRQDYVTSYLHGREVTLELSNIKKLESENFDAFWDYNKWSLINMISQSRYGIHGNVTSKITGFPIQATILVEAHDDSTSWVKSDSISGNFYRYLKEGSYDIIISADGYINDTVNAVEIIDYQKTSLNIVLDSTVSTFLDEKNKQQLSIYPNPATDFITVSFKDNTSEKQLVIYNSLGKVLYKEKVISGTKTCRIDISFMESGYYLLELSDENKASAKALLIR